ncbi:hypothetical protein [Vibrio rotiferianus]|uniref:hypothetical protein n=1 Tax=Vibrio rotiferianus TaxID=190895 RepID=UPI00390B795A
MRNHFILHIVLFFFASFSYAGMNDTYQARLTSAVHYNNDCVQTGDLTTPSAVLSCFPGEHSNGLTYESCRVDDPSDQPSLFCEFSAPGTSGSGYIVLFSPPPITCESKQGLSLGNKTWSLLTYGSAPKVCLKQCEAKINTTAICAGDSCNASYIYSGSGCDYNGAITNRAVPKVCRRSTNRTGYDCPRDVNGDKIPNDSGAPYDHEAICGFNILDSFACTGGSFDDGVKDDDPDLPDTPDIDPPDAVDPDDGDTVQPDDPPDKPDVDTPDETDNSGVISAIVEQNKDINTNFDNSITAMNKGFADINTRLNQANSNTSALNDNLSKQLLQDYKIYKDLKENIRLATKAINDGDVELAKKLIASNDGVADRITDNNTEMVNKLIAAVASASSFNNEVSYGSAREIVKALNDNLRPRGVTIYDAVLRFNESFDESKRDIQNIELHAYETRDAVNVIKKNTSSTKSNTAKINTSVNKQGNKLDKSIKQINDTLKSNDLKDQQRLEELKAALSDQTESISGALSNIKVDADFDGLSDSLASLNGALDANAAAMSAAAGSINGITGDLEDLIDELKPCEPNADNNYCENPHGLNRPYVASALGQATNQFNKDQQAYDETVTDELTALKDRKLNPDSEYHIEKVSGYFLDVLPRPSSCSNFSFPLTTGHSAVIDCSFSEKLKMILSILIYIYTIKTLVEILLTEVTPVPSNKAGSSGRYY